MPQVTLKDLKKKLPRTNFKFYNLINYDEGQEVKKEVTDDDEEDDPNVPSTSTKVITDN